MHQNINIKEAVHSFPDLTNISTLMQCYGECRCDWYFTQIWIIDAWGKGKHFAGNILNIFLCMIIYNVILQFVHGGLVTCSLHYFRSMLVVHYTNAVVYLAKQMERLDFIWTKNPALVFDYNSVQSCLYAWGGSNMEEIKFDECEWSPGLLLWQLELCCGAKCLYSWGTFHNGLVSS